MNKMLQVKTLDPGKGLEFLDSILLDVSACTTLFSYQNACFVLDPLSLTPLRTDGDPSGFHRTRRDQQTQHKHREAHNSRAEGGGVDISTLPDNITLIVVRYDNYHLLNPDSFTYYHDEAFQDAKLQPVYWINWYKVQHC